MKLVLDCSPDNFSNYERLRRRGERVKVLGLENEIIVLHVEDSPFYKEMALRSAGILREGEEYFIGIEKTLSPEQLKLLEERKIKSSFSS